MASIKGYVSGTRWHGIKQFLFGAAAYYQLELTILDRDRGWIRETVYYKVEGDQKNIDSFEKSLEETVKAMEVTNELP